MTAPTGTVSRAAPLPVIPPMLGAGGMSAEPVGFGAAVSLTEIAGRPDASLTDTLRRVRAEGGAARALRL
ncbi:hypothetical protein [Mycetocola zhadangensis]|uniref:hypothetical protein n=1 Tax=Mycetocola zhadangensis TaxID=1164595 RepID=UPI0011C44584|nr:hypothetical protein [Mycetocola zhadangensis]GGE98077.1 hypothetical protein GCM10011313_21360 [Mycetocola zhadangensis]